MKKSTHTARYDAFREALIAARHKAGFTQRDVAEALQRPPSFVAKYERGERRLDVVEMIEIADALGISPMTVLRKIVDTPVS